MASLTGSTTTIYGLEESTSASDTDVFAKATSSATNKFTFANLVSAIKAKLGGAATCDVANNVTTTASGSVLDARQGKVLQDQITANADAITELNTEKVIIQTVSVTGTGNNFILINENTGYTLINVYNADWNIATFIPYNIAYQTGNYILFFDQTIAAGTSVSIMEIWVKNN